MKLTTGFIKRVRPLPFGISIRPVLTTLSDTRREFFVHKAITRPISWTAAAAAAAAAAASKEEFEPFFGIIWFLFSEKSEIKRAREGNTAEQRERKRGSALMVELSSVAVQAKSASVIKSPSSKTNRRLIVFQCQPNAAASLQLPSVHQQISE